MNGSDNWHKMSKKFANCFLIRNNGRVIAKVGNYSKYYLKLWVIYLSKLGLNSKIFDYLKESIMKIAVSDGIEYALNCNYRLTEVEATDFTNIAAIVVTMEDLPKAHAEIEDLGVSIPVFVAIKYGDSVPDEWLPHVYGVLELADDQNITMVSWSMLPLLITSRP